jgi:hypothetical protein
MKAIACAPRGRMTLERILFGLAGTVLFVAVVLTITVSHWFSALAFFVIANLWLYAAVGNCPSSLLVRKLLPVEKPAFGSQA